MDSDTWTGRRSQTGPEHEAIAELVSQVASHAAESSAPSRLEGLEEGLSLYMQDFTFKPITAESQDVHPKNTSVVIVRTEKSFLHVESLRPMTEELRVKLPSNTRKCILSLYSDEGRYFGFTELGNVDLDSVREELGIDRRFERELATDKDLEPHLISFGFSVRPRDAVQLDSGRQESAHRDTVAVSKSENLIPSPQWKLSLYLLAGDAGAPTRDPELLNVAGHIFLERYISSKLQINLDNSIRAYELAIKMLSPNDAECSKYQFDASIAYYNRFHLLGRIFDINCALAMLQSAIDRAPEDHYIGAHRTGLTQNMAVAFDWTKYLDVVSKHISSLLGEIESTPEGDANLQLVNGLALCLKSRFELSRYLAELFETTLTTFRKASCHNPSGNANDSGLDATLDRVGLPLEEDFEQGAIEPKQLSMMIASFQDVSFQLPPAANLADITESLSLHQKVVQNTPNDHPELPGYLCNFGNTLQCRFKHTGSQNHLSMAIFSFQCAVELTPEGETLLPARWIALGSLLKQRFELDANQDDLSKATSAHRSAVKSSQIDDVDYLETLNNLGLILLFSFDHTKDLNDLSEAVKTFREMVDRTPDKNPDLPRYLNNLGESLRRRFRQVRAREDLSDAISSFEKALEISSDTDEAIPAFLTNLALAFQAHFHLETDTKQSPILQPDNNLRFGFSIQFQSRIKKSVQPPDTDHLLGAATAVRGKNES